MKKKSPIIALTCVAALFVLLFTCCQKTFNNDLIIGTWNVNYDSSYTVDFPNSQSLNDTTYWNEIGGDRNLRYTFNSNGRGVLYNGQNTDFEYHISGSTLYIYESPFEILRLNASQLIIENAYSTSKDIIFMEKAL